MERHASRLSAQGASNGVKSSTFVHNRRVTAEVVGLLMAIGSLVLLMRFG
jgi:hypothetical protein